MKFDVLPAVTVEKSGVDRLAVSVAAAAWLE
jgi:hypothetical protein